MDPLPEWSMAPSILILLLLLSLLLLLNWRLFAAAVLGVVEDDAGYNGGTSDVDIVVCFCCWG